MIVVEAAEDEPLVRQTYILSPRRLRCNCPCQIVDLIAVRQVNDLFGKERLLIVRQDDLVRDHVIYEISPHRSGVAQVIDLNRGPDDAPEFPADSRW